MRDLLAVGVGTTVRSLFDCLHFAVAFALMRYGAHADEVLSVGAAVVWGLGGRPYVGETRP